MSGSFSDGDEFANPGNSLDNSWDYGLRPPYEPGAEYHGVFSQSRRPSPAQSFTASWDSPLSTLNTSFAERMRALEVNGHDSGGALKQTDKALTGGGPRHPAVSGSGLRKKSSSDLQGRTGVKKPLSQNRLKTVQSGSKLRHLVPQETAVDQSQASSSDFSTLMTQPLLSQCSLSFLTLDQLQERKARNEVAKEGWYVEAEMRLHYAPVPETRYEISFTFRSTLHSSEYQVKIPLWDEQVHCLSADKRVNKWELMSLWEDVKTALEDKLRALKDMRSELVLGLTLLTREGEIKIAPHRA